VNGAIGKMRCGARPLVVSGGGYFLRWGSYCTAGWMDGRTSLEGETARLAGAAQPPKFRMPPTRHGLLCPLVTVLFVGRVDKRKQMQSAGAPVPGTNLRVGPTYCRSYLVPVQPCLYVADGTCTVDGRWLPLTNSRPNLGLPGTRFTYYCTVGPTGTVVPVQDGSTRE
jgi:hypothetical protein